MDLHLAKLVTYAIVGAGGALGTLCRFAIRDLLPKITNIQFPLSTLLVNLVGCFLAGLLYAYIEQSGQAWSENKYLFFFVGFLGAFTTFSAFALDSLMLMNQAESLKLFINIMANCLLCLVCVFFGAWVGGRIAAH